MNKVSLDNITKLQKMNPAKAYCWLLNFYKEAFEEGLREGEKEFDDAVILTEEEAKIYFPEEAVEELLSQR